MSPILMVPARPPLSRAHGELLTRALERGRDQARRPAGTDLDGAKAMVERLVPAALYVHAAAPTPGQGVEAGQAERAALRAACPSPSRYAGPSLSRSAGEARYHAQSKELAKVA